LDQHNPSYGVFFSHVPMLCEILRRMIGEPGVELLDFVSAERVDTPYVFDKRRRRESDIIWKLRRRDTGDWLYAFVLLELPPREDRYLPVSLLTFKTSAYEVLFAQGYLWLELEEPWREPSEEPTYGVKWLGEKETSMAPLFRLRLRRIMEASRVGVARLHEHMDRDEPGLRNRLEGLLGEVIIPLLGTNAYQNPEDPNLEDFEAIVAERIASSGKQLREEMRQRGVQEGKAELLLLWLEKRFGLVDQATRERIAAADDDLLLEWMERTSTAENLADVFSG
jgi:hypothetical protein